MLFISVIPAIKFSADSQIQDDGVALVAGSAAVDGGDLRAELSGPKGM
jgi:hypothetical protein